MSFKGWLDLITTIFIVGGGILALLQLRQAYKQRVRDSALQMLHSFQTPEFLRPSILCSTTTHRGMIGVTGRR
jgi:hypothetical protein